MLGGKRTRHKHKYSRLIDWGLTTLSAQIGYTMPLKSVLQLKSEINEKVDNISCWEYIQ